MVLAATAQALIGAEVPVTPGADEARRWAQDELSGKVYQDAKPGWSEIVFDWLRKALADFLGTVGVAPAYTGLVIVGAVVLVAIIVIIAIVRPRLNKRKRQSAEVFPPMVSRTAQEYRALAQAAAASGDFATAISEQFRAMVRAAEERDIIALAPGRTALEASHDVARSFPQHARGLQSGAELFNAVRYGHVAADAAMFEELLSTDSAIMASAARYETEPSL